MKKIKMLLFALALGGMVPTLFAQHLVNSAGELVVASGGYLVVSGDIDNTNNGIITVNGSLSTTGDFTSTPGASVTWGGSGDMIVNGGGTQVIDGVSSIRAITIDNSTVASLAQNTAITGSLALTSGKVSLGNFDLSMGSSATISGASATNYILTGGSGSLVQETGGVAVVFPVGTASGYNPVSLANSGTTDNLSVRIVDNVLKNGSSGSAITSHVVDRTWFIDEAVSGSLNLSATFQWDATDELTSFDRGNTVVYHYTGGNWQVDGSTGAVSGSDPYSVTVSGITTLSPFSVGDNLTTFPVEWLSFTAVASGETVLLEWATASELHSDYFAIERSAIQDNWEQLAILPAAGISNEVRQYRFMDRQPLPGHNQYRLRQVDLDGAFSYSSQVEIDFTQVGLSCYPNPVRDQLTIRNPETGIMHVEVMDLTGRRVSTFEIGEGKQEVSLEFLNSGVYTLRASNRGGSVYTFSFFKQ